MIFKCRDCGATDLKEDLFDSDNRCAYLCNNCLSENIMISNEPNKEMTTSQEVKMKPKENKKGYQITLTPSIKERSAERAEKLNMSLSAYIEELLKEELGDV